VVFAGWWLVGAGRSLQALGRYLELGDQKVLKFILLLSSELIFLFCLDALK
jgi:hypothetical protein